MYRKRQCSELVLFRITWIICQWPRYSERNSLIWHKKQTMARSVISEYSASSSAYSSKCGPKPKDALSKVRFYEKQKFLWEILSTYSVRYDFFSVQFGAVQKNSFRPCLVIFVFLFRSSFRPLFSYFYDFLYNFLYNFIK